MCAIIHHVSPPGPWQPYDGGDFIIWHTNTAAGGDTGHALLLWRRWRQSQIAKNINPKLHSIIAIPRVHQWSEYTIKLKAEVIVENEEKILKAEPIFFTVLHRSNADPWLNCGQWGRLAGGWWRELLNGGYLKVCEDFIITPSGTFTFKTLLVSIVSYM